jgi:pimeloyl-ACP methyl ester carboxylesterase
VSTPPFLSLPEGAVARTLSTSRGPFAVHEALPPGGARPGRTALLVPGFTGSKEDFIAVLGLLAGAGYRVVSIDQRGQFETPGPAAPEGWTLAAFGADVLAVAAALDAGPVHLLGHSFGGLVVREAVLADPTVARSLVLLCSGPAALDQRAEVLGRMADGIDTVGLAPVWAITRMMELESGSEPHQDPAVTAFLERRFMSNDPGCLAAMARILATTGDRTTELAEVAPPTLVMCGEDDDAWDPKIQQQTASQLRARFVSLPEAAHSPAAERPEVTARQLAEFWDAS